MSETKASGEQLMKKPWTTTELAILREHYPTGGVMACLAHLPGRTVDGIRGQVQRMGLRLAGRKLYRRVSSSEHIDAAIRTAYASGEKGAIKALAERIGRPYGWIKYRAGVLGCRRTIARPAAWCAEELDILERHAHHSLDHIKRMLKRAGFERTLAAIQCRVYKIGLDTSDPDSYSASEVARLLGVNEKVVTRWIFKGWLAAKKKAGRLQIDPGEPQRWRIRRADLRAFIRDYPAQVDLRRADRFWLIELLAGRPAQAGREAA